MSKYKVLEFRFISSPEFRERVVQISREAVRSLVEDIDQFNLFPREGNILIPRQYTEAARDSLEEVLGHLELRIEEVGDQFRIVKKEGMLGWGAPYFDNK